jgi:hypothetical protein
MTDKPKIRYVTPLEFTEGLISKIFDVSGKWIGVQERTLMTREEFEERYPTRAAELSESERYQDELEPLPENKQVSGPQCKVCGAFTTHARVDSHRMCMKCETFKTSLQTARSKC